jgi:hypothetical protein
MRARGGFQLFGIVAAGALVGAMFVGTAGAAPPVPITGTGTVSCRAAGRVTFSPPLATGGTATSETLSVKANLLHCTGTADGATVAMAKVTGTATFGTNDCAVLGALTSGSLSTTVQWKTKGGSAKLADSTVVYTAGTGGTNANGKSTLSLTGTTTAGSFNGTAAAANVVVSQATRAIGNACAHGTLKGLTVNASGSTVALS